MLTLPRKCSATEAPAARCGARLAPLLTLLATLLALAFTAASAQAAPAGSVTALDGTLLAKNAAGGVRVLWVNSPVEQGDTLTTRRGTYARVTFRDNTIVTVRPETRLTVEKYAFDQAKPQEGSALLRLDHGGVRVVGGVLGKRNAASLAIATPSGTLEVGGASIIAEYVEPAIAPVASLKDSQLAWHQANLEALAGHGTADWTAARDAAPARPLRAVLLALNGTEGLAELAAPVLFAPAAQPVLLAQNTLPAPGAKAPGLYVQVIDGLINLSNKGGSQNFAAGQFGYTASFVQPPVVLPSNPGMQFTPPPAFSSSTGSTGGNSSKGTTVDCVVR